MNEGQKHLKKRKVILLLALTLIVIVGIGVSVWQTVQASPSTAQATATATGAYKTTTVRRSDLTLAVSGSGTVITNQAVDLGFSVAGTVAELNVQVGDKVTKGQVLAALGDTASLKQNILDQQLAVQEAQKALDDLQANAAGGLAQAQIDLASAQTAYNDAQKNLHQKGDSRCMQTKTEEYYYQYLSAQSQVNLWEGHQSDPNTGYGKDYILTKIADARKLRDQTYSNYTYCQGYTDKEIQTSQSNLQLAKAKLDQANTVYENLKGNSGIDSVELAIAQADLNNAKLQLAKAEQDLAGTTITAPMDGTVTVVTGSVSDEVQTGTFITISDLADPVIQVNVDETDLDSFAVGCTADVTFASLSGETFSGKVTQVSPALVTVNSSNMVQGLVDLQKKQTASGKTLPLGLTAAVEVTCKQAKNVLVVPAQALYEPSGQSAYVYVLTAQGKPEKRDVVVGLKTVASAEITSGLTAGEKVVTTRITSK